MTQIFTTLLEGSPSQIHDGVFETLTNIVEGHLQARKQLTIAKIFETPFELKEKVQRKPWTKATIRESLEEATLVKLQSDQCLAESKGYSKIRHQHDQLINHGFFHQTSYPSNNQGENGEAGHVNTYKHADGHKAYLHSPSGTYHVSTTHGANFQGQGTEDLKGHLKHLDEYRNDSDS